MHFENVVSCFDGMSCGQLALLKAGHTYTNYYAIEIDRYAMRVSKANFPNTIYEGSILGVDGFFPKVDLFIGGSPCQGFSFAGKQLNFEDPRSALFFEFVRLKDLLKPTWFLLENVRMKKESKKVITSYMGVDPILINSALVCAQNRRRLYWTNIPGVEQPKDRGIFLKDILQSEVDEKYYINNKPSFKGMGGLTESICVASRGRNPENTSDRTPGAPTEQRLEPNLQGKTNCLTSVAKDNLVLQINPSKESGGTQPYQQNRVYDVEGISWAMAGRWTPLPIFSVSWIGFKFYTQKLRDMRVMDLRAFKAKNYVVGIASCKKGWLFVLPSKTHSIANIFKHLQSVAPFGASAEVLKKYPDLLEDWAALQLFVRALDCRGKTIFPKHSKGETKPYLKFSIYTQKQIRDTILKSVQDQYGYSDEAGLLNAFNEVKHVKKARFFWDDFEEGVFICAFTGGTYRIDTNQKFTPFFIAELRKFINI